jgi:predicted RNase H-like HicB family nuclease
MLSEFLENKLKKARYKLLPNGSYFGEIPGVRGVWADSKTLENCREELREVLEEWVLLKVRANEPVSGLSFPTGKSHTLNHA